MNGHSNVICVSIQLSATQILEDTLNVCMKSLDYINATFAKRDLVKILNLLNTLIGCTQMKEIFNVIYASIQHLNKKKSENIKNVSMKS
jgi:hypothetical protein